MNQNQRLTVLAFSRAGFEHDLCAELEDLGASDCILLAPGLVRAQLIRPLLAMPVFARDVLALTASLQDLPRGDRVAPIAQAIAQLRAAPTSLIVLAADSDQGRKLAPLAKSIGNHLSSQLAIPVSPITQSGSVYVVFVDSDHAALASVLSVSNSWPGGIARLRMPHLAPSRSTLKLDEAFTLMLDQRQRRQWLRPGMHSVDLGAAPGGWTWQLVQRGMQVIAIDNGPLKGDLLSSGLVQHLRADGFTWRPKQPVDWLVCDMVAKPGRVVERIARWLNEGWCDRALFNLKLPMQRRFASWQELRQQLIQLCVRPLHLSARHLYHDREEITVLAWSEPSTRPKPTHVAPAANPTIPSRRPAKGSPQTPNARAPKAAPVKPRLAKPGKTSKHRGRRKGR